jgi:regulator of RNase E activity RraA
MSDNPLPEIVKDIQRVSPEVVKKASAFQAAILADVAGRRGTLHGRIAPIAPQMKLAGPAFTIEVRGGDNLMIHTAMMMDGAARDTLELRDLGFPVFCVGANPNGPTKFIPGRINHPVSCGGICVNPGDLIVGDADGVVVVERGKAASLLDAAQKKVDDETARIAAIRQGQGLKPKWLDESLRAAGLLKAGETL